MMSINFEVKKVEQTKLRSGVWEVTHYLKGRDKQGVEHHAAIRELLDGKTNLRSGDQLLIDLDLFLNPDWTEGRRVEVLHMQIDEAVM